MPIQDALPPSLHNLDIERIRAAVDLATFAHAGQVDKSGEPYLWHCLRVGAALLPDVDAAVVGILHDILEDTDTTKEHLAMSVNPACFKAILALTRKKDEEYEAFIHRICLNPLAIKVKVRDCLENSSLSRLNKLAPEERNRLRNKYANALNILWMAENSTPKE
jgi:(p)ppGpp synthase/HD superfamily hydrolase